MSWAVVISGLSLGLLSSFHCVGMCGPIAFAMPALQSNNSARSLPIVIYHLGRIVTYTVLGLIFGLLGRQVYLAGFQQTFSISLGILMLLLLLLNLYGKNKRAVFANKFQLFLITRIASLLKNGKGLSYFLLGLANGLLPCGMVYLAIAGALVNKEIVGAMGFMAAFGAGTLPTLLALQFFRYKANLNWRNIFRQITPYIIALTGILLILRGLNLGIPYISPILESAPGKEIICH